MAPTDAADATDAIGSTVSDTGSAAVSPGEELLRVEDLAVHFTSRSGLHRRPAEPVRAVDGISFTLATGETLGLVGESGCGKSTTALAVIRLVEPTAGRIVFRGEDITEHSRAELRRVRRDVQIVFQDPHASVNPRMTVSRIVAEPLEVHGGRRDRGRADRNRRRVAELLRLVGLSPEHGGRYPHQFSGGQLQRVGIARALALDPKLLILDEPVSALDVSIQAQIITLLQRLQNQLGLAYLFISHDLSVIRHISHHVAVMHQGKIVEAGDRASVYGSPTHAYTKALLAAVPVPDPDHRRDPV